MLRCAHQTPLALFTYLAQEEGRKPRAIQFSCAEPLQDAKGTIRFLGREKCTLLADYFEARLSDPQLLTTSPPPSQIRYTERSVLPTHQTFLCDRRPKLTSAGRLPLQAPYNRPISGDFNALSQEEARKALSSLACKKAPAPDGLKWDLCRSLTSYDPLQYHHAHWALPDLPSASLPDPS